MQKTPGRDLRRSVAEQFGTVSELALSDRERGDVLQGRRPHAYLGPDALVIG
jgi:hypothetical protein